MSATARVLTARRVSEDSYPGRRPRVGDRLNWSGTEQIEGRLGTIIAVYPGQAEDWGLLLDIEWDEPVSSDPTPWVGTTRGYPLRRIQRPEWVLIPAAGR